MTVRKYRNSAIKLSKRCGRSYWLKYVRNLQRKRFQIADVQSNGRADLGTWVHAGYEAYYRGEDWSTAISTTARASAPGDQWTEEHQKELDLAHLMFEGYVQWVEEEGRDVGYETIGVELQLEMGPIPILGDEVYVTGKVDRLVRSELTGAIMVDDAKTRDQLPAIELSLIDDQIKTYAALVRANFPDLPAPTIGRHTYFKKSRRTARAKPPFYKQSEILLNEESYESHWAHLVGTLTQMVMVEQQLEAGVSPHLLVPPNPTRDCSWDCPFLAVCPMFDNGQDAEGYLSDYFEVREDA